MTDRLSRLSSGSADASALDVPRTMGMSNGFGSSQDLAGLDHIDASLHSTPYPVDRTPSDYHRPSQASASTLFEWYHQNDGPWNPIIPIQLPAGPATAVGNLRFQYRDVVPSECSTILPSDSGYASYGAKYSVTNNSVCDESFERNTETQSLVGNLSELSIPPLGSEVSLRNGLEHKPSWQTPQRLKFGDHSSQPNPSIKCETCNKTLKTPSELK